MKTKYWILLLALIVFLCAGLSIPLLLPKDDAQFAEVLSNGRLVQTVDLAVDREFTVTSINGGTNTVTVRNGKIGVTRATCPDHYCMDRGMCGNGVQIVCLPNRLIIRFLGSQTPDSVVG